VFCRNASVALENCIVSFGVGGAGVACQSGGVPSLSCCDVFGNPGGDWIDCIEDQFGFGGNTSADPFFCDPENGDFMLAADSPCGPGFNPECGLIGASPVGCAPASVPEPPEDEPPAAAVTWGGLKALFRP
jgi:hypothetical protein